jgi:signal transduction histidine kinase
VRNRLLLVFVGVVAVVLLVHDVPLARYLGDVERDRLETRLQRDAFVLAGRAEEALEANTAAGDPVLIDLVTRYTAADPDVRIVIVDADGAAAVVVSDPEDLDEDFSNRPEVASVLTTAQPDTDKRFSTTLGYELFYVSVPVLSGDEVVGVVRFSAPERIVSERTNSRVRGLFVVAAISLVIAVAVAWLFAQWTARPLRRLLVTTQTLAGGDLAARAETDDGPPEVRDLASGFNSMAGRLEALVDRQRSFAGTASHQMRTPLTALRLRLEQLGGDELPPDAERHLEAALGETDRLHRLIEGWLALSRAEASAVGAVETDLAVVARERAAYWEPLAAERGVDLVVVAPDQAAALAVAGAAEQIVDNLVDNALDVSPAGSTLTLAVHDHGDVFELHVVDEGPGLAPDDRLAAFDRFWRGRQATPGGSGLGLAIVRQLAQAGGGDAELRESASGGIDATVRFAAASRRLRVP